LELWPDLCEQVAWRLLVLTEQLRPAMDALEQREDDPDRLGRLYQVDHGVTRMRRVARDLRVLAGRGGEEFAGHTTSLVDVIRVATSAIEHYDRVSIGPVAELAVVAYAADDVASVLAALADNATRYSPSVVRISAHLLADGGVMLRVEDAGLGIDPGWLAALNSTLDRPPSEIGALNGRHTGFPVVHRLASRHGLRVQLARREPRGLGAGGAVTGTIAMVVLPAPMLCEIPDAPSMTGIPAREPFAAAGAGSAAGAAAPGRLRRVDSPAADGTAGEDPASSGGQVAVTANGLPRRERASIRTPMRGRRLERGGRRDASGDSFAFAEDLRSFSAGQPAATAGADDHRSDGEGQEP
jgi:hypothetical protein